MVGWEKFRTQFGRAKRTKHWQVVFRAQVGSRLPSLYLVVLFQLTITKAKYPFSMALELLLTEIIW